MKTNNHPRIGILGWGSLLWDPRPDFDDQIGGWDFEGPTLNLEFSRISTSRSGSLTLVIDDEHGAPCKVAFALSKRRSLNDALADLQCREGTIPKRIGWISKDSTEVGQPDVPEGLKVWVKKTSLDYVVWTGLPSNFKEEHPEQKDFSVEQAIAYLANLPAEGKAKAAEYIWRAPELVKTPLREAIQIEPWFKANA